MTGADSTAKLKAQKAHSSQCCVPFFCFTKSQIGDPRDEVEFRGGDSTDGGGGGLS